MSSIEMVEQAVVGTITHQIALPAIGVHWVEEGGIFAGIVRGANGAPDRALIVCPDHLGGELEEQACGEYGKDVAGAQSKTDGAANTRAMAEAGSEAAQKVRALDVGGKSDWHIGSQAEMHVAAANVPEHFSKDSWYWTSTQLSRFSAFVQAFDSGYSDWNGKDTEFRVRAVRTIQLQPLTA